MDVGRAQARAGASAAHARGRAPMAPIRADIDGAAEARRRSRARELGVSSGTSRSFILAKVIDYYS